MTRAPMLAGDLGCAVTRVAVNNQDLGDQVARQVGNNTADGRCLVIRRNNDRDSQGALPQITTTERMASAAPTVRRRPTFDRPVPPRAPSDAITGTSSSQIHAVPHSDTHRLPR